jgi:hypothetical protein
MSFNGATYYTATIGGSANTIKLNHMPSYNTLSETIYADKYADYDGVTESKLLMYPYTALSLDDFKGNHVTLKNEYISGNSIVMNVRGSVGTSNKVAYNIDNYLNQSGTTEFENAIVNNSPNDLPILSDYLAAYLQGNRNTIENQKNSIMFNGVTNAIGSTVGGVASALSGNAVGLASSATSLVQGAGNSVLQLQGIQAKIKDIDNTPATLVKMGGNPYFDYGNNIKGVYVIKKQITPEYQKKLTDFFKMYGYKVNEVKTPNFHTRQSWNYVQTSACNITGNINNEDLRELTQVFDNGITLWHTDDVGNYSLGNEVI